MSILSEMKNVMEEVVRTISDTIGYDPTLTGQDGDIFDFEWRDDEFYIALTIHNGYRQLIHRHKDFITARWITDFSGPVWYDDIPELLTRFGH